jgi:hypothetical protein
VLISGVGNRSKDPSWRPRRLRTRLSPKTIWCVARAQSARVNIENLIQSHGRSLAKRVGVSSWLSNTFLGVEQNETQMHVWRVAAAGCSCRGGGECLRLEYMADTGSEGDTYRIANFLGFAIISGHNANTRTKHASAPRLQPPKIRSRSHLLTMKTPTSVSW